MFLVIFLYFLLASTFVFAKKAVAAADPFFLITSRMILSGIILMVWAYLTKKKISIEKSDLPLFFATALFHIFLAFNLEFWALQYVSALKTIMIYSTTPFITALLSYLIYKELLSLKKIIGVGIGLLGMAPLFWGAASSSEFGLNAFSLHVLAPELILLAAVFSAAYAWFLVKKLMTRDYNLLVINGYAMLIGGLASVGPFLLLGNTQAPIKDLSSFLLWTLGLIFVANICVYNLYGWLLQSYSLTFISFAGFLCPIFGAIFEYFFLGGSIAYTHYISFIFIFIGLRIFYQEEFKGFIKQRQE